MNVLWVSAHTADPTLGGGWAHEHELLASAADLHRVTVVSGELEPGAPAPGQLTELGVEVVGARAAMLDVPKGKLAFAALLATKNSPLGAWAFAPVRAAMLDAARHVQQSHRVDLVHVFPQESAPIVGKLDGPTALLLGDSYTVQAERELESARSTKDRIRLRAERRHARRYERRWYPMASAVACVSPYDAAALQDLCGIDVGTVPVAVGDEWFIEPGPRSDNVVVLVGALDYWPNVEGTTWFCSNVWPIVSTSSPRARLKVVGRRPTDEVRAAVASAGGELFADVPDVRPYFLEAAVAVAPTRLGSGVKNKVLHAAACRAPQVGTTFAFEGTGAVAGKDVMMADTASGLADAVLATLADPVAAGERANSALLIAQRHSRAAAGEALEQLWDRALQNWK